MHLQHDNYKGELIKAVYSLEYAQDIIFERIVNIVMEFEMQDIHMAFDVGDTVSFELSHFKDSKDPNVLALIEQYLNLEDAIDTMKNVNAITQADIDYFWEHNDMDDYN